MLGIQKENIPTPKPFWNRFNQLYACKSCQRTDRKHLAKGYCTYCYAKYHYHANQMVSDKRKKSAREYYERNKKKIIAKNLEKYRKKKAILATLSHH